MATSLVFVAILRDAALRAAPQSLTQNAANEIGLFGKSVMPGLVPGIHVFWLRKASKTWMAGTSPAMTKKAIHSQAIRMSPKMLIAFSVRLSG
jgi:hypothetical protein